MKEKPKKVENIEENNKLITEGMYMGFTIKEKKKELKLFPKLVVLFSIPLIIYLEIIGYNSLIAHIFLSLILSSLIIFIPFAIKHGIKCSKYQRKKIQEEIEKDFK